VELLGETVRVHSDRGTHDARYVIDATGQQNLMGRQLRSLVPIEELGRAAAFCHLHDVTSEVRARLSEHGDIEVLRTAAGWAWVIPLVDGKVSIGVVGRGTVRPQTLRDAVSASEILRRHCEGATLGTIRIAANYSYRNTRPHGSRYACIGDAGCFLDPVFSTGVTLALASGRSVAERVATALSRGDEGDPELLSEHAVMMRQAFRTFYALIYRFYHTGLMDNILLSESEVTDPVLRQGLVSVLAADVWRSENPFLPLLSAAHKARAPETYW
jgi:flavin-dependent dehydrogenase